MYIHVVDIIHVHLAVCRILYFGRGGGILINGGTLKLRMILVLYRYSPPHGILQHTSGIIIERDPLRLLYNVALPYRLALLAVDPDQP